jgi:hypothetical protein
MNLEESCLNSFSAFSFSRFLQRAPWKFITASTGGFKASRATEIMKSKNCGARRPSFYVLAASCALGTSAFLFLFPGSEFQDPWAARLLGAGWQSTEDLACSPLRRGSFYELENEESAAEAYVRQDAGTLAAHLPLPAPPYQCREIPQPSFVSELE